MEFTTTQNGALANLDTGSRCLDFFTSVMARDKNKAMSDENIIMHVKNAYEENRLYTLKLIMYLRDCRGGKGEKHASKVCLRWLNTYYHEDFVSVVKHLPFYGSWKDMVDFFHDTDYCEDALCIMAEQLVQDKESLGLSLGAGTPEDAKKYASSISLAAKWAPSEGCTYDRRSSVASKLASILFPTESNKYKLMCKYRTEYISPLRSALNVVERLLCSKQYSEVNFSFVPSRALMLYGKKCFPTHMGDRFSLWKADVLSGKRKVNTSQVDPYEIINRYLNDELTSDIKITSEEKALYELFYVNQIKELREKVAIGDTCVVADTSGSMAGTPMAVSISLAIWLSSLASGPWHDIFINFNTTPEIIDLSECQSLETKFNKVKSVPWGGNTNLQATFDLLLSRMSGAEEGAKMVKRLIIISDMEFDVACLNNSRTNLQTARDKFASAGYPFPNIVFWNVSPGSPPASTKDDRGVTLVGGFSKDIVFSLFTQDEPPTPYELMVKTLNGPRYERIQ